jgi:hypothetical protein
MTSSSNSLVEKMLVVVVGFNSVCMLFPLVVVLVGFTPERAGENKKAAGFLTRRPLGAL